eukprot:TRINITY_DN9689_c0_g1_i1.p1 TRINITY_DN9689_c0_g1~~TRINITY_DN9689_c0_g1_i1.p1  ORF type:complete len:352 (+),score=53.37 TRINITY_DN9689_c0_g1_i1:57-1112(+)
MNVAAREDGDITGMNPGLASRPSPVVALNVYNLTRASFVSKVGGNLYHSGIEVYGKEWAFGGSADKTDTDTTGVYWAWPQTAYPHFEERIELGISPYSVREVEDVVMQFRQDGRWTKGQYHPIQRNCNHFAAGLAASLLNVPRVELPAYVNRAAYVGSYLPDWIIRTLTTYSRVSSSPSPDVPAEVPPPPACAKPTNHKPAKTTTATQKPKPAPTPDAAAPTAPATIPATPLSPAPTASAALSQPAPKRIIPGETGFTMNPAAGAFDKDALKELIGSGVAPGSEEWQKQVQQKLKEQGVYLAFVQPPPGSYVDERGLTLVPTNAAHRDFVPPFGKTKPCSEETLPAVVELD